MGCCSSSSVKTLFLLTTAALHLDCLSCFLLDAPKIASSSFGRCPSHQRRHRTHHVEQQLVLAAAASTNKKNLSAAERERRDEEKRRRERVGDVVIGKTSAIKNAKDYSLDISATEEEWMRQASKLEQEIWKQTEHGMKCLSMLQLEQAAEAFDRVFELRPSSYLWQAGIVKYYLNELEEAADIFARNAATYESKFGLPATEERIWRHACELKLTSSIDKRERKRIQESGGIAAMLTQIVDKDFTAELLRSESRMVLRTARNLFNATVENDYSALILSRAKLRSIAGTFDLYSSKRRPVMDRKMWKIQSWFYLGLHYDALGEAEESKKCMKMALRLRPSSGKADDIIHTLPMLHMSQREWFDDDDDFDSDLFHNATTTWQNGASSDQAAVAAAVAAATSRAIRSVTVGSAEQIDPVFVESMKSGIAKLRLPELQDALRLRGIPAGVGSKDELRTKLFDSMLGDTGLLR